MKESLKIAGAFIGLIIGAGFASGQEILQFFTSFGVIGIIGGLLATILFAFLGMQIAYLGSSMSVTSHKDVVYKICGRYLGVLVDIVTTFFLFGVASVMLAGSGAVFEQQFGIPSFLGSIIMLLLTLGTVLLNLDRIIVLMGLATPFMFGIVILIAVFALFKNGIDFTHITSIPAKQAAPNWWMGGLLYVSYNIAAGASMLMAMSGSVHNQKDAARGGMLGGLGLGILILIIHFTMLTSFNHLSESEMPILTIASSISPWFSVLMAVILLVMIYNTSVGMLYAFSARIINPDKGRAFKIGTVLFGLLAYAVSFLGFSSLVGTVYPVMGYLGFILMIAVVIFWFRNRNNANQKSEETVLMK
ncbi:YkvI family membrane protein [Aneurinibacillus tyrosinisolvens]|uniref:YkvI family membrane protein n=1 Tax=Aneurinibacillus tyrosinisolvens TaxID=1443435 RepID=UPI00063EEDFF|nr:membrane protein [Aneurinibacillus tyrosinisolvens]